jgi:CubicO group peptidase (beta-lactamase class C family)
LPAQAPAALDAAASDPVKLGWMVGFPPPPDKIIRFADDSWFRFPQYRWSFSNIRQLVPTRAVPRHRVPVIELPRHERNDLDAVTFTPLNSDKTMTWEQSLAANYTDGILILHRGRIVYEKYFGALHPDQQHIAFSVTKSFVGTLAAILIHERKLDAEAPVSQYLPEMKDSGLGDATIRQLLDMTTGPDYTEDYTDPNAGIWKFAMASGLRPRPAGYQGPASTYEYLKTLKKAYPHGQRFHYKTVNTDTLAWVMSRVTGEPLSETMRERFWRRLGMEQDGYFQVDSTGVEFAGGGLNLTLRDLVRFGEMLLLAGRFHGVQSVPAAVINDIRRGADREQFAGAGYKTLPGWSYRNMWWVSHNAHGAFMARGIHGQGLYIDPKAEMVIARFASHPMAGNVNLDPTTLPAFHAMALHLMKHHK